MNESGLEAELSRFASELRWEDLPPGVQARVLGIFTDTIANALVGRQAQGTPVVESLLTRLCGEGDTTVVGGGSLSPTGAVFLNGHQITAYTMCDVYRPALCHITPEVLPVVLALAEELDASGREVLAAFAVGLEVTARLGRAIDYPEFRRRGWHAPGVIGPFGAAAAAASLLGLDAATVRTAFGLAGSQASGTFAALGTSAVKFHQARGAVSGLWAARFAAEGRGGTDRALTHPDGGLLTTYAGGGTPQRALDGLGETWELLQIALRAWPASSSLQTTIEASLALRDDHALRLDRIAEVVVRLPDAAYEMCAHMGWGDELEAMQSARYVPSVVLRDGYCWVDQYTDHCRKDATLTDFAASRVRVERVGDLPNAAAEVAVTTSAGETHTVRREAALGGPAVPLGAADIRDKLDRALDGVATRTGTWFAGWLQSMPFAPGVTTIIRGLRAAEGTAMVTGRVAVAPAAGDTP